MLRYSRREKVLQKLHMEQVYFQTAKVKELLPHQKVIEKEQPSFQMGKKREQPRTVALEEDLRMVMALE